MFLIFYSDSRSLNAFWVSYFLTSKSVKSKSDQSALQDEYINLLRKHRRKRKFAHMTLSSDSNLDISNISLNDVIARVADDSDNESTKNLVTPGKPVSFAQNSNKFFSMSPENSSKLFSSSNFTLNNPQKKKSRPSSTTTTTTTKTTLPLPLNTPTTASSILPTYLHQPSTSSSVNYPPSLINSSSLPNSSSLSFTKENDNSTYYGTNNLNFCPSSIKSEPMDIFEFRSESPPHSFPLPSLSRSLGTSSSQPAITSFTSLIPQPIPPPLPASEPRLISDQYQPPVQAPTSLSISVPSTIIPTPNTITVPSITQGNTLVQSNQEVYKAAPTSFFAFLRDIFYVYAPNDYRMTLHKVEEMAKEQLREIDPKLGWTCDMVQSAMNYLSGVLPPPDMIPLVDYKEKNQQWQWIGVNRDNDEVLLSLYRDWMDELDKNRVLNSSDPLQLIPAAICFTTWTVRPTTDEEKKIYRDQEAIRYQNPHKAFTFRVHGYTSVVGPVKGCGIGSSSSHATSPNKAREHAFLVSDRPPFVTLLSLVRDAAARLPNGEGTRADICELLRDSQYILPNISDQQVNGIVSGALDRLHYEKDPCVKYDVNRKVWIYLHRNRSEEEFERLHDVQIAAAKAKRGLSKNQRKLNNNSCNNTNKLPASASTPISSFASNSSLTPNNTNIGQPLIEKINQVTNTLINSTLSVDSTKLLVTEPVVPIPTPTLPPLASVISTSLPPVNIAIQPNSSLLQTTRLQNSDSNASVTLGSIPQLDLKPELLQPSQLQISTNTLPLIHENDLNNAKKKTTRTKTVKKQFVDQESVGANIVTPILQNIVQTSLSTPVSLHNLVTLSKPNLANTSDINENVRETFGQSKPAAPIKPDKPPTPAKSQSNSMKVMPIFSTLHTIPATMEAASLVADKTFKNNVTSTTDSTTISSSPIIAASTSQLVSTLSANSRTYMVKIKLFS